MSYTLKSNATTAAASLVWCASEGLTNLVNAAAVTKTGTLTTATVNGRATLGSNSISNYLSAAVGAIAANTSFSILVVQAYGVDPKTNYNTLINSPTAGWKITSEDSGGGANEKVLVYTPYAGASMAALLPSDVFSAQRSPVLIIGRDVAAHRYNVYVDGTATNSNVTGGYDGDAIAAGSWQFAGSPPGSYAGGQKTALFAIFIGVKPDDLAAYIAAAGGDPFAALFDGTVSGGDTTAPTHTGAASVGTVTSSTVQVSWPAGTDNTAVTSYETSLDGTTWTDRGNVLTYTFTGLSASTNYTFRVRAKDAAGNVSSPALQVTQATAATGDAAAPTMNGTLAVSAITTNSYTLTWVAASDNVAVTGYELSLDGGATYSTNLGNVLTTNVTGRTAGTTDQVRVRAYDAAGNKASALGTAVTLVSVTATTSWVLKNNTGTLLASTTVPKVKFLRLSDMAPVLDLTNQNSAAGTAVVSVANAALVAGTDYLVVCSDATGANAGIEKVTAV